MCTRYDALDVSNKTSYVPLDKSFRKFVKHILELYSAPDMSNVASYTTQTRASGSMLIAHFSPRSDMYGGISSKSTRYVISAMASL